jgi:beta-lactamase regulating signal transducer with metallopeptidase domain
MGEILSQSSEFLNRAGESLWDFAGVMFAQVTILVLVLLALELLLRNRVRAVVRYSVWLLVLVKLVLPVGLHTPASIAYWLPTGRTEVSAPSDHVQRSEFSGSEVARSAPPVDHPEQFDSGPPRAASAADENVQVADRQPIAPSPPTAMAAVVSSPPARLHWEGALFGTWLLAVALLLAIVARRALWVRRIVHQATDAPRELHEQLRDCLAILGMTKCRVGLKLSDRLGSPAICGLWRPTILLPRGFPAGLDREQIRLVFVHELIHWRRGDLQVNCCQTLLQILYFYNPAVWIANLMIRRLREQAIDEAVLVALRSQSERYATTLLDIAGASLQPVEVMLRLIGVVESRRALSARIRHILNCPIPRTAKLGLTGLAAIATIAILLLPMGHSDQTATAQDEVAPALNTPPDKPVASKKHEAKSDSNASEPDPSSWRRIVSVDVFGRAVNDKGRPVSGATVFLVRCGSYQTGDELLQGKIKTDVDGKYEFRNAKLSVQRDQPGLQSGIAQARFEVFGTADGYGFAWQGERFFCPSPRPVVGIPADKGRVFYEGERINTELVFSPAANLHGQITDDSGRPLAGARVELGSYQNSRSGGTSWSCAYLDSAVPERHEGDRSFEAAWLLAESLRMTRTDAAGNYRVSGLPREARLIGRVSYQTGFEEKTFAVGTTGKQQQGMESPGYDGVLNFKLQAPRVVTIQVNYADSGKAASGVTVRVRGRQDARPGILGKTDDQGSVRLLLPKGDCTLIAEPRQMDPYVTTERQIEVDAKSEQDPVRISLPAAALLTLEAVDPSTGLGVSGVDFLVGSDRTAELHELQSQTVYVDHPKTDEKGRLNVFIAPGDYRFVVNTTPGGYTALRKTSEAQHLVAGQNPNVRIDFKKTPAPDKQSPVAANDDLFSQLPASLVEKWEHQIALLRHGKATIKLRRGNDSWIKESKLESLLTSFDPAVVPELSAALKREYPRHDFGFADMKLLADGDRGRATFVSRDPKQSFPEETTAFNGKEVVIFNPSNNQAAVYGVANCPIGTTRLSDICFWPWFPRRVNATQSTRTQVAIGHADGKIKITWQDNVPNKAGLKYTVIADETTGFVYQFRYEGGDPGKDTGGHQIWQFAPHRYPDGAIVPGLHLSFSFDKDRVNNLTAYQVESLDLDAPLPPDAFVVAAQAGAYVIDHRGGELRNPKRRIAHEPLTDVVSFANSIPDVDRSRQEIIKTGDKAPAINPAVWLDQHGETKAPELDGKVVLVDFGGVGCGPCMAQLAEVEAAAQRSASRDFRLIGLFDAGETVEVLTEIARKRDLTYPIAIDRPGPKNFFGATFAAYGIRGIPQAAVIGSDGRLVFLGELDEAVQNVERLLREKHE